MNEPILVFDMDGVLVDVTESYREAISRTAEHFTGAGIANEEIQRFKNEGGWNDDWQLSHHIIRRAGVDVPFEQVVEYFQHIFLGNGADGLILREKWVARPGALERLNRQFRFAVFTGRPQAEARMTLDRFAPEMIFDPIVGMHDVANRKPAPDGLLRILDENRECKIYYVGDTVDDARCARAAGVPFIGIAAPENPHYLDLVFLFQGEGACAIVDDINYLEEVFA
ncbi:MAG TPA: TIGR01548 family HAD-type hydrolase [Bryobacteraceae bacterium]|nr:TIGR01548 family HAD-type hydrolase [Bryobacteraceae bacterium]